MLTDSQDHVNTNEAEVVTPRCEGRCVLSYDSADGPTFTMHVDDELVQRHELCSDSDDTPFGCRTPTWDQASGMYIHYDDDPASACPNSGYWSGTSTVSREPVPQYYVPSMPSLPCMHASGFFIQGGRVMDVSADRPGVSRMAQMCHNGVASVVPMDRATGVAVPSPMPAPVGHMNWCYMAIPNAEGLANRPPGKGAAKGGGARLCSNVSEEYRQAGDSAVFDGRNYFFPDGSTVPQSMMRQSDQQRACWHPAYYELPAGGRLSRFDSENDQDFDAEKEPESPQEMTTLMIRNIPNRYTRKMLMDELDVLGFQHQYDFIYVPMDKCTHRNVGYGFVNFTNSASAHRCMEELSNHRFRRFRKSSGQMTQVSPAHIQGLQKNLQHFSHTAVKSCRIMSHRPLVVKARLTGEHIAPAADDPSSGHVAEAQ